MFKDPTWGWRYSMFMKVIENIVMEKHSFLMFLFTYLIGFRTVTPFLKTSGSY